MIRSIEMRNFSDLKDVEVRRKEIGRLHWRGSSTTFGRL
jgi:hypothetical protein